MASHHLVQEEVCDTCGDVGVKNAIITCPGCNVGREHLYCMRKNSVVLTSMEGFNHFKVSDNWRCEMCAEAMVVDMEVDMIGGKMVGPIDIVVQKHSIQSNIPPGFSSKLRRSVRTRRPPVWLNVFYM